MGDDANMYQQWILKTAVSAELAEWVAPESEFLTQKFAPISLESVTSHFAVDNTYLRELSKDALPRDFYRMPAHKHYRIWPQGLRTTCGNTEALLELYARVKKEDWCAVRRMPEYLERGFSHQCVPEDRQSCKCCGEAEAMPGKIPAGNTDTGGDADEPVVTPSPAEATPKSFSPMFGLPGQLLLLVFAGLVAAAYVMLSRKNQVDPEDAFGSTIRLGAPASQGPTATFYDEASRTSYPCHWTRQATLRSSEMPSAE